MSGDREATQTRVFAISHKARDRSRGAIRPFHLQKAQNFRMTNPKNLSGQ